MPSKRRKNIPELKVVFDTSVLFSGTASSFLRKEVATVITENSNHDDLKVTWIVPSVVMHERQYQMRRKAFELLPSLEKLERLLGHNLNITRDILVNKISAIVAAQATDLGVSILELSTDDVDWSQLVDASVYRRPPFDAGESEKGFRDAVIAQTVFQLVACSPSTPRVCRIAFVTSDKLLTTAVQQETSSAKNVRLLESVDALQGLINTLVSEVSEEFVTRIRDKAAAYFYAPRDENTIYYRCNIRQRIDESYSDELRRVPNGATSRQNVSWEVRPPRFVRKHGQRVTWASRIVIQGKAYSKAPTQVQFTPDASTLIEYPPLTELPITFEFDQRPSMQLTVDEDLLTGSAAQIYWSPQSNRRQADVLVARGESVFEVTWVVSVSTRSKLSHPKVIDVDYVETTWDAVG